MLLTGCDNYNVEEGPPYMYRYVKEKWNIVNVRTHLTARMSVFTAGITSSMATSQ